MPNSPFHHILKLHPNGHFLPKSVLCLKYLVHKHSVPLYGSLPLGTLFRQTSNVTWPETHRTWEWHKTQISRGPCSLSSADMFSSRKRKSYLINVWMTLCSTVPINFLERPTLRIISIAHITEILRFQSVCHSGKGSGTRMSWGQALTYRLWGMSKVLF